jgi:flagellar biosynthesis protein FlhF
MPLERFTGTDFSALLARARATLGEDAVIVSVRRGEGAASRQFELVASDPDTARSAKGVSTPPAAASTMRPLARSRMGQPLFVVLVGPTGAGKTTTLAKLANHPQVFGGWPAGLLCLDTYRVGALEQLRMYAELSGLPLEVAYAPNEVPAAVDRLSGCEVVLVDTAGRGPRQSSEVASLLAPLRGLGPIEVHLVLPAGLRAEVARRFVVHHRPLGLTHLIVTKLDECPEDDAVFALADAYGLGIRWACDGQEVPHDLHSAASKRPQPQPAERESVA